MELQLSIWSDLLDRVVLTATTDMHLYSLPNSNLIIHAQRSSGPYLNLTYVGKGMLQESAEKGGVRIYIHINEARELQSLLAWRDEDPISIQIKKTSDVNDLFKQYVCLFTNLKIECIPVILPQYYTIIEETKQSDLIFLVDGDQTSELEQKEQKKLTKKALKSSCLDGYTKLQNIFKDKRNAHKDQLDQIGKITSIKHPLLISVGIFIPQVVQTNIIGLQIVTTQPKEIVTEWLTYHKYDSVAKTILEDHLKAMIKSPQNLFFNDQISVPLIQTDSSTQEEYFLLKHIQLSADSSRLIAQAHKFEKAVQYQGEKLYNVHQYLSSSKALEGGQRYCIRGDYVFHHYMQNGFDDKGWGCAYRSFMTVLSWLVKNGYARRQKIPSHKEIQTLLVQMNDKPRDFVDSCEWIGAFEVNMLINHLTEIESKILHISSGPDIVDKLYEFKQHFLTQGTPIMFGGGVYAYTLLGIDFNQERQCKFLILDPHYIASDNIKTVIDKGGISWKNLDMFLPGTFYNFCMPQVQSQ